MTRDAAIRELRSLGLPTSELYIEQMEHHLLCKEAAGLGIPVSLDDPDSPATLAELQERIAEARAQ